MKSIDQSSDLGKIEKNAECIFEKFHVWQTAVAVTHQLEQDINCRAVGHSLTGFRRQPSHRL